MHSCNADNAGWLPSGIIATRIGEPRWSVQFADIGMSALLFPFPRPVISIRTTEYHLI